MPIDVGFKIAINPFRREPEAGGDVDENIRRSSLWRAGDIVSVYPRVRVPDSPRLDSRARYLIVQDIPMQTILRVKRAVLRKRDPADYAVDPLRPLGKHHWKFLLSRFSAISSTLYARMNNNGRATVTWAEVRDNAVLVNSDDVTGITDADWAAYDAD